MVNGASPDDGKWIKVLMISRRRLLLLRLAQLVEVRKADVAVALYFALFPAGPAFAGHPVRW